jgi:hypothetical protein
MLVYRAAASMDGKDVVVIQTKCTPLSPYVFGQALLSMDLILSRPETQSRAVSWCLMWDQWRGAW